MVARGVPTTVSWSRVCPGCVAVSEANERVGCVVAQISRIGVEARPLANGRANCPNHQSDILEEVSVFFDKRRLPLSEEALPGRSERMPVPDVHFVNRARLTEPFPDGLERAVFGMGCFWGAEKKFWELPGVYSTSVGYAAGFTPNPTYREVCSGMTGHNEVVQVVFDPRRVSYDVLLRTFWENHDPTQGMRQGNDVGTQYRSGIYYFSEPQREAAERSRDVYAGRLRAAGHGRIT